ncbi:MAG: hypothetical protein AAFV25_05550, partial [Bacteroidota bacterium]
NRKKVVEHFIWRIREDGIYEFPLKRKVRSGYRFDSKNTKGPSTSNQLPAPDGLGYSPIDNYQDIVF